MRRKLSLLLCLVMLLSGMFLPSCKEEKKDREYDAEVVLREAALLVERSKLINFIFWGDGIPVREGEEAEKLGTYTEADGSFLEQHGIDSVDKLKKMTSEVYDKAFCNTIFETKLAALQDSDGNRISLVRYYQKTSKDESGDEIQGPIMVHTQSESICEADPVYHTDTLVITGVSGQIVHLTVEVSYGTDSTERITVPVDLIEEENGWRLVSPTYVGKIKK